jgi:hypothetical protein
MEENSVIEPITTPAIPIIIAKRRNFFCLTIARNRIFEY